MSILNIVVTPAAALVCADTDSCHAESGEHIGHIAKLVALPHMNAIIACRGTGTFMFWAVGMCLPPVQGFDELLARMGRTLDAEFTKWKKAVRLDLGRELTEEELAKIHDWEIMLVGWSPQRQRVVAFSWQQQRPRDGFEEQEIAYGSAGPRVPDAPEPYLSDRVSFVAYARLQAAWLRKQQPPVAGGGKLIIVETTRDRMSIEQACDLEAAAAEAAPAGWPSVIAGAHILH